MRVIGRKLRLEPQGSDRANPPAALAVSKDNIAEVPAKVALEVRQIGVVARRLSAGESRLQVVECAFTSHHRAREETGWLISIGPTAKAINLTD